MQIKHKEAGKMNKKNCYRNCDNSGYCGNFKNADKYN